MAAFIAGRLREIDNVEVTLDEVAPGRPNVLARVQGTADGPHLCLNVHTDTVGCASWPDTAFTPRRRGDDLLGLGVADNKAQCAALMMLVKRLAANPSPVAVTAIFAVDEEGPLTGTHHLLKSFSATPASRSSRPASVRRSSRIKASGLSIRLSRPPPPTGCQTTLRTPGCSSRV